MSNQNIIQIPPNFIVKQYKAQKRLTKRVPFTTGISFFHEPGVTYEFTADVGTWKVQSTSVNPDTGDAVTEFYVTVKGSTLGDLYNSGKPLTINLPPIDFANGETARLYNMGAMCPDTNFATQQQAFVLHEPVPGFYAASWNSYFDIHVRVTIKGSTKYIGNVREPFYPFPYEVKYIGLNNIPYIHMAAPTFVDIDIVSLFLNPQSIQCNQGDEIYLLHKNV